MWCMVGLHSGVLCLTSQLESRSSAVFKAANRCKLLLHCTCMGELPLRTMTNRSVTHNGRVTRSQNMSLKAQKLRHSLAVVLHMGWNLPSETC